MLQTSFIEISESALRDNIHFLRSKIGPSTVFSSVVKANAYGHGIEQFVGIAEKCGVRHFSVFCADEANRVLQTRTCASEIMIMGAIGNAELAWAVENDISFYIFDLQRLTAAAKASERMKKKARIHLELETGLHRTGLERGELRQAIAFIESNLQLFELEGVCTHYAGAESVSNYYRIKQQIKSFNEQCRLLRNRRFVYRRRHSACSAAAFSYPQTVMDMVRFGIAQYGFWPSQETRMQYCLKHGSESIPVADPLRRVMCWKSYIMCVKEVPPGSYVSYGNVYLATKKQRIASVPVGYSHGFTRSLSNLGHVLVRGRRAPVVGMVNMSMMLIDVTDQEQVLQGDEVVIIGKQLDGEITVGAFSDMTRDLNYEVLVRLPGEISRRVVE